MSSTPDTTTQTNLLDPTSAAAVAQKNSQNTQAWNSAQNVVSQNPTYPSYPGALVQNFTPDQIAAMQMTEQNVGTGQNQLQAATALTGSGAKAYSGTPFQANATTTSTMPQNYQSYMSPYINGALNNAATQMERVGAQNKMAINQQAAQAGAFGGDRQGVQDAMNDFNTQTGIGNMYSQGLQGAITQAGQQFTADQGQSLASQQGNNATALAGFQANANQFNTDQARQLAAGQQMGALGTTAQNMAATDASHLMAAGTMQQQQGQAGINAQLAQFQQQFQQPYANQALLNATNAASTPGVSGSTQTGSASGPSETSQIIGGVTTAAMIAAMAASSRDFKEGGIAVDDDAILAGISSLPIERWKYKKELEDGQPHHIGTYAEEFRSAFGVGDGKHIPYVDALGVLMAGTKALNRRLGALEKRKS